MENLKRLLVEEQQRLSDILQRTGNELKDLPEGSLRVAQKGARAEYYHYKKMRTPEKHNGTYIKRQDIQLAHALAQKDYDQKIIQMAQSRLRKIGLLLSDYEKGNLEEIYETLSAPRKELVNPFILPDKEYVEKWTGFTYDRKPFAMGAPEMYTEKGERVRSKSEKILADKFFGEGIPYRYECPLFLKGAGWIYPDFTLLDLRTRSEFYWEHCGMMDEPEYCSQAVKRINMYIQNGIIPGKQLILSFEARNNPLNIKNVEKIIKAFLG